MFVIAVKACVQSWRSLPEMKQRLPHFARRANFFRHIVSGLKAEFTAITTQEIRNPIPTDRSWSGHV
jgi:hypothetical protein